VVFHAYLPVDPSTQTKYTLMIHALLSSDSTLKGCGVLL
jgi:hypothetical protein